MLDNDVCNEKLKWHIGTEVIVTISNIIKRSIASQYIFVRYMGPKFAIAFSGVDMQAVQEFIKTLKGELENIKIPIVKKTKTTANKKEKQVFVSPTTNFVISTYYKGTGLESVTKKLEEYLDDCDTKESNINCI